MITDGTAETVAVTGTMEDKRRTIEEIRRGETITSNRDEEHPRYLEMKDWAASKTESSSQSLLEFQDTQLIHISGIDPPKGSSTSSARPSIDPKTPEHIHEDGEAVDDDAGMMAAMGLAVFGSTEVLSLQLTSPLG